MNCIECYNQLLYCCRVPHGAEAEPDVPRVLPADHGGGSDRPTALRHLQCTHLPSHTRHILSLHAAPHHPRRRLLYAQPPLL